MSDAELAQIGLGGGLDETNEDSYVPPTAMRFCENVVFPDGNTCVKRQGLHNGASVPYGRKLLKRGGELLITDGAQLFGVQGSTTTPRGRVSPCMVQRGPMATGNLVGATSSPDFPVVPRGSIGYHAGTGYSVRAWSNGLAVAAQIVNEANGAPVTQPVVLNSLAGRADDTGVDNPRVCILGNIAFVLFPDKNATTRIQYRAIDLTNIAGGWTTQADVFGTPWDATSPAWDAEPIPGTSSIVVVTCVNTSHTVNLVTLASSGFALLVTASALVDTTPQAITCCAVRAGSGTDGIIVTYSAFTGALQMSWKYASYTTGLSVLQAATGIRSHTWSGAAGVTEAQTHRAVSVERVTGQGAGATAVWMFVLTQTYQIGRNYGGGKTATQSVYAISWTTSTTVFSALQPLQGPMLHYQQVAKPRAVSVAGVTRVLLLASFATAQRLPAQQIIESPVGGLFGFGVPDGNQTTFLVELPWQQQLFGSNWTPMATTAVLAAGDLPAASMDMVAGPGSTLLAVGTEVDQAKKTSLAALRFDFASTSLWQSVELGTWTFIAGGMPQIYDGSILCESGFLTPPPPPMVTATGTGTGGNPVCQYIVVEVQQDAAGNIHRSAPSNPVQVDLSTSPTPNLVVFSRRSTLRQAFSQTLGDVGVNPIRIQVYRNTKLTPTVFYLVGEIQNDTSVFADGIDFADSVTDAAAMANAVLYTQGGIVESEAPPSLSGLTVHADRMMGIADDGRTVWFTTASTPGEYPRFSISFTLPWPDGRLTALWSLEQRLHAATADRTYYVIGEGPTDANTGSDWTTPQLWNADLGAIDPRSVAVFEKGALVYGKRGLYLEGRDGSWTWLGQKVRRTLGTYPVVTAIVPRTTDGVVQIACNAAAPTTVDGGSFTQGTVVHWNHSQQQFATHFVAGGGLVLGADDAIEVQGTYSILNTATVLGFVTSTISTESLTDSLDGMGTSWVTARVVTGWFELAGKQGSVRVSRVLPLLAPQSAHGLTVATARDRSATFDADVGAWTDAEIAAMVPEQVRHTPTTQKGMAMSVAISDVAPTSVALGTGEGPQFVALLLRGRTRRGEWKSLTPTQQR